MTAKLAGDNIDVNSIEGVDDIFNDVPQPFEELETRYIEEKYF